MNRKTRIALFVVLSLGCIFPSMADVGVTDSCQDDAKKLGDKIRDDKDDYTSESRRKAKNQLAAARTNRLNPAKCRGNIRDAREELRKGKHDKKKKKN